MKARTLRYCTLGSTLVSLAVIALSCYDYAGRQDVQQEDAESVSDTTERRETPVNEGNHDVCPSDMVEVEGDFCPAVVQECLKWLDPDNKGANGPARCAEFRQTKCLSRARVHMHFCIDKYEWPNRAGVLPQVKMSYYDAERACSTVGKRLCDADEFTLSCEGPDMKPYPYGDGYHRDSSACNIDRPAIDPFKHPIDPVTGKVNRSIDSGERPLEEVDQREPAGSHPECVSPYGAYDMVGNADEWVYNPRGNRHKGPWYSGLKGGHWVNGARNRCRPMTEAHGPDFSFYVTSTRCCASI